MDDTFSFAGDVAELPDKIKRLESVITRVLQQIAECAFFIRAYVSRPFAGTPHYCWICHDPILTST